MPRTNHLFTGSSRKPLSIWTRRAVAIGLTAWLVGCVQVPPKAKAGESLDSGVSETDGAIWALEAQDELPVAGEGADCGEPTAPAKDEGPAPAGPVSEQEEAPDDGGPDDGGPDDGGPDDGGPDDGGPDDGAGQEPASEPEPDPASSGEPSSPPDTEGPVMGPDVTPDVQSDGPQEGEPEGEGVVADPGAEMAPAPVEGELVITEVMPDPAERSDSEGEWVELYNAAAHAVDLATCRLGDDGSDGVAVGALIMEPGDFAVLARSAQPGFTPDLVVPSLSLRNSDDVIVVRCEAVVIDRMSYGDGGAPAPVGGASLALSSDTLDAVANDLEASWCVAQGDATAGDLGTPGAANGACEP